MTSPGERVVAQLAALADQAIHRAHGGEPQMCRFTHRACFLRGWELPRSGSNMVRDYQYLKRNDRLRSDESAKNEGKSWFAPKKLPPTPWIPLDIILSGGCHNCR